MSIIAFQGIHGAYSEQAIRQHYGDTVEVYPVAELSELFQAVRSGKARYCLLPVENAMAGAVSGAYELLLDQDLTIQAEIILHVHHNLMVVPGTAIEDIQFVRSHPQALAQCEQFLKRRKIKPVIWYDTAGSAADLSKEQPPQTAAIASQLAAQLYKLEIVAGNIEDVPHNFTRFFVLGTGDAEAGTYNKTSLVFATRHRPAALYDCLGEFATRGINITKIESRPRRNRPWEPVFYLDIEGHWQDESCQEAIMRLLQKASFVKLLGSYPAVATNSVGI